MSRLGADPVELRQLGAAFNRLSVQAEHTAATLDRKVRYSSWRGVDARDFAADWQRRHRPFLQAIAITCARCSAQLRQQAQQQEHASASGAASRALPPTLSGAGTQGQALRAPAAFPTSELRLLSGAQVTAGALFVGITNNLSIQQFPKGRVRIVSTEGNQVGSATSAGVSVAFGTQTASFGANLRAQVGIAHITRREYLTVQDKLLPMLAVIEAEAAVRRAATTGSGIPGLGIAAMLLSEITSAGSRGEQLTEFNITAQGSASLASSLGVQGAVRGTGSFRFGRSQNSQILELEGTAASLISGQLLQRLKLASVGDAGSEVHLSRLRIEIPDQAVGGVEVVVSTTTTDGHSEFRSVSNLDVSETATLGSAARITQALEHLQHGKLDQALHSLAQVDLPTAKAASRSGEFSVNIHTGILGANIGAGVGLGISGDGGYQQLRLVS